ncbi:NUDIX hydrolase domain-like protein [Lenzites betulinus]|nr:NUDIX hydrolase domain-like protein [Lenzites betulinus]
MTATHEIPAEALETLSPLNKACIERLRTHQPEEIDLFVHLHNPSGYDSSGYPSARLAAVLVLLYEKAGDLRVLLTTRSKSLRSHPGQVAFPGGKVDTTDKDVFETAYREAHEETGFPRHYPHAYTVCTLRPYISSAKLFVTPVVALLTEPSILETLVPCPGEVDRIFSHPLPAVLDPHLASKENLAEKGSPDWIYEEDYYNFSDIVLPWLDHKTYRMHRFRSTAFAIKGLTSDILIATASIAYDRQPSFERWAPGQLRTFAPILPILESQGNIQDAPSGISTPVPKVELGIQSTAETTIVSADK